MCSVICFPLRWACPLDSRSLAARLESRFCGLLLALYLEFRPCSTSTGRSNLDYTMTAMGWMGVLNGLAASPMVDIYGIYGKRFGKAVAGELRRIEKGLEDQSGCDLIDQQLVLLASFACRV